MFEGKSFIDVINMGGYTLYVLLGASILSITVICFKLVEFWIKSKMTKVQFLDKLLKEVKMDKFDEVISFCDTINSPMAPVVRAGIIAFKENKNDLGEAAMEREIMLQTIKLERFIVVLGTLGNITVYIGLFGTVLGIIRAFHDISKVNLGSENMSIIIEGVSEALIATAAGLFVAIPAVIAYNFFVKIIDKFVVDMEYCSSVIKGVLENKKNR
ncbi:MAG: MotA/TolQ/ExbB proton channel family protein [Endomicrobium sp.]|jgi:biopolymer transport protein ExbB/TolQ|nr:MotA/TolQ/ExbB proton channel family protein [Endomicrobium sp.]